MEENKILNDQIEKYQFKLDLMEDIDSIRVSQLKEYYKLNTAYANDIKKLNAKLSKKNKALIGLEIGSITVTAGLILFLILR